MKRIFKKIVSATLVAAMFVAPVNVFAMKDVTAITDEGTTVKGDSAIINPVYKVALPTALTFSLDPLTLTDNTNQVISNDFAIVNRSNVGITVTAKITATPATSNGPTLLADNTTVYKDLDGATKNAFFAVNLAKAIASGATFDTTKNTANTDGKYLECDNTDTNHLLALDAEQTVNFILAAATYDKGKISSITADDSVAGFTFHGELAPYAKWAAKDISVNAVYKITGLSAADFGNYKGNSTAIASSLNAYSDLKDQ